MTLENKPKTQQIRRETEDGHRDKDRLVPLPAAPVTGSPVPWLTSLHATPGRGPYGDPRYRGNCSGRLIKDLLCYYQPRRVLDPMQGGGTCRDVCTELGIPYCGDDLRAGFDATRTESYATLGRFDFVWLHPPYWRMIRYSDDPRCLSNAPTLSEFLERLRLVFRGCLSVLAPGGHLAVLMGDGKHQGRYLGLPFHTLCAAEAEGLWLAAPEIVRFSHGTTSARQVYRTRFIPRLHDLCLVLGRDQ